jgi:putative alpha-1,2-mannosidase
LNGKKYSPNYIRYSDIQNGGEFIFNLDENPNKNWGSQSNDVPYSLSLEKKND